MKAMREILALLMYTIAAVVIVILIAVTTKGDPFEDYSLEEL